MRVKCPNSDIYLELPGDKMDMKFTCPACKKVHRVTISITTPGEVVPVAKVPPQMPKKWGPSERATVSFGHGINVSPMHVLLSVNAMTNGGIYIYPTLRKRALGAVQGVRVISDDISAKLRAIMFDIAEMGSGKLAKVAGINIGGKTSTAEKRIDGKIDRKKNLTSFIAAFPIEAPQYIMLVMLDEPAGTPESFGLRTAAWNVVPTAGKILDSILPMLFD